MSDPVLIKQRIYRTKLSYVEAQQYDGSNASACAVLYWLGGHQGAPGPRLAYVDSLGNLWVLAGQLPHRRFELARATYWIVRSGPQPSALSVVDPVTFLRLFELEQMVHGVDWGNGESFTG